MWEIDQWARWLKMNYGCQRTPANTDLFFLKQYYSVGLSEQKRRVSCSSQNYWSKNIKQKLLWLEGHLGRKGGCLLSQFSRLLRLAKPWVDDSCVHNPGRGGASEEWNIQDRWRTFRKRELRAFCMNLHTPLSGIMHFFFVTMNLSYYCNCTYNKEVITIDVLLQQISKHE